MSQNTNNPKQPQKDDAVLGGADPAPIGGVVLGGLEGVKHRLSSAAVETRIAALSECLNYGEAGLDLVARALQDKSKRVRREAYSLLRDFVVRALQDKSKRVRREAYSLLREPEVVRILQEYKPWNLFERFEKYPGYRGQHVTKLANRNVQEFDPKYGITDSIGIAYALRAESDYYYYDYEITDKLAGLLRDPHASNLEALVIGSWISLLQSGHDSSAIVNALVAAKEKLPSLKALFLGDIHYEEYEISWIRQSNMSPILEAYPNLEMLQIRGGEGLTFSPTRHDNLKILVIETGGLSYVTIGQVCALELPALEHLELWLGRGNSSVEDLMPILAGDLFPNLTYLGLRNSQYSDKIAAALVDSPVLQKISVLDLSMGTLGNKVALALLESPAINQLDILNVSETFLSDDTIEKLQQLDCQVIADDRDKYYEYCDYYEDEENYENYENYECDRYCSVAGE